MRSRFFIAECIALTATPNDGPLASKHRLRCTFSNSFTAHFSFSGVSCDQVTQEKRVTELLQKKRILGLGYWVYPNYR